MPNLPDHTGVVIFPPLLFGIALLIMLGLWWLWPLTTPDGNAVFWLGAALIVLGLLNMIWGLTTMHKAKTNVSPFQPTTALVTYGPFRFSRNPLYLTLILFLLGISLMIGTWWGLAVLLPVVLVLHFGIILREERYLEGKFGESYRAYKNRVRRYL